MSDENTLLETQIVLADMMKDLDRRILDVYDKYTDNAHQIPKLPDYKELKSGVVRYTISKNLTDSIDELSELKLRVGMLYRNFKGYQDIQPPSKVDYNAVQRFKLTLKSYLDSLEQYRFEISDLIKNANNKLRILESIQYGDI